MAAHWYGANYRQAYDLFLSTRLLFNHESWRRGETFVARKIRGAVRGSSRTLLGYLELARQEGTLRNAGTRSPCAMRRRREDGSLVR